MTARIIHMDEGRERVIQRLHVEIARRSREVYAARVAFGIESRQRIAAAETLHALEAKLTRIEGGKA
jgi:hypothetical protein